MATDTGRRGLIVLMVGLCPLACATNPATGDRELALISEQQEIELGRQAAAQIADTVGIYDDPASARFLAELGRRIAAKSERPGLPWQFQVADDPVVNAFALPGGFIFVTRGLLAHLGSEAQLASVVGHEIGHVTARHSVNQMSKASLAQLGLVVGMAVSETVRSLGQIGVFGLELLFLKYGRDAEREADALGLRYLVASGYDANAMPKVFATLDRVSEASGAAVLPTWLSTHPPPEDRITRIEALIAKTRPAPGAVDRSDLLAVVNGMVYGADPRQGFFEQDTFKHPRLRFQLQVPPGWQGHNLAQAVIAEAPGGDAGFQLSLTRAPTPTEALERWRAQEGVQTTIAASDLDVPGLPSRAVRFRGRTEAGEVAGMVSFVAHAGRVFQLLALTKADQEAAFDPTFRSIIASFGVLTDPAALAVAPARIRVVAVPAAMSFREFAATHPGALPAERLAILNQLTLDTRVQAGQRVKVIEGQVRQATTNVARREAR